MKSSAQVVVIGGGVVGCSVLYHLTKRGWKDVVLVERNELTSGSTWHAAGGFHTLNGDPNVAKLQEYTIELYKEIEEISEQATGIHVTGGIMMVSNEDRWDWLKAAHAKNRYLGVQTELISVEKAHEMFPLMDPSKFIGAMWHPLEGHLDPSGTTHAYARAARKQGAEIYRQNRVTDLQQRADGTWDVITEQGIKSGVWFAFPHFFLLPVYASASAYRVRPLGPEETLFEIWSLTTYAPGDEPPAPVTPVPRAPDDERWPWIPAQDFANLPRQQRGLHAEGFEYMRLAQGVEGTISNFERLVDGYLAGLDSRQLTGAAQHVSRRVGTEITHDMGL